MTNLQNALLILRHYTRGHYNVYDLAGPDNKKRRAEIFSALFGHKVSGSQVGVNALRCALLDSCGIPQNDSINRIDSQFAQVAEFICDDFFTPEVANVSL